MLQSTPTFIPGPLQTCGSPFCGHGVRELSDPRPAKTTEKNCLRHGPSISAPGVPRPHRYFAPNRWYFTPNRWRVTPGHWHSFRTRDGQASLLAHPGPKAPQNTSHPLPPPHTQTHAVPSATGLTRALGAVGPTHAGATPKGTASVPRRTASAVHGREPGVPGPHPEGAPEEGGGCRPR